MSNAPCGHCIIGIYSWEGISRGEDFCAGKTLDEALKKAPMCKINHKQRCVGAIDFIASHYLTMEEPIHE